MLVVENLTKSFAGDLRVLAGVSFRLESAESLAIVGPSGSGKSTLLHIVGTLDRPDSGSVLLNGVDPFQFHEKELAAFRNQRLGFIFQEHHLLPQCDVLENVLIPTLVDPHRDAAREEKAARELLERVGLSHRLRHAPSELSGGERQRVAVARALLRKPSLLLADEPTGNLDRRAASEVGTLLAELAQESQAIVMVVTHSEALAARFARRARMTDGILEWES